MALTIVDFVVAAHLPADGDRPGENRGVQRLQQSAGDGQVEGVLRTGKTRDLHLGVVECLPKYDMIFDDLTDEAARDGGGVGVGNNHFVFLALSHPHKYAVPILQNYILFIV